MIVGAPKSAAKNLKTKRLELADVMRQFGPSFLAAHKLSLRHRKVMQQIINCRTSVLGGHRDWCARCGFERFLYHSCRNRHCPKCQTSAKERWREARQQELLPVPYFHNVFTLPHELNSLFLKSESNQRQLLNLLFETVSQTLLEFGEKTFGGQIGFTLVLHTWDQQLRPHYHLHCLIPAGALMRDGKRPQWIAGGNQFLFPVRGLSKMFRARFLTRLRELFSTNALDLTPAFDSELRQRQQIRKLFKKSWVVYSKAPFAGPAKLLDYLSRYTHRVALTNNRLANCDNGQVTFNYRDRRDGDRRKRLALPAEQLISRFLTHVLPDRLMRIRYYGFLANRFRKVRLEIIRQLLGVNESNTNASPDETQWLTQWLESIIGAEPETCPCCGDRLRQSQLSNKLNSANRCSVAPNSIRGSPDESAA